MASRWLLVCLYIPVLRAARIDPQDELQLNKRHARPPRFPSTFEATYNFSLPYVKTLQADGLTYPVHVWRNADTKELRIDTYDGVNSLVGSKEYLYKVIPRLDRLICSDSADNDMFSGVWKASVLPDISQWEFDGYEELRGFDCIVWTFSHRHGRKETVYHFHVTAEDRPVRLHMHGNDIFSGAHFDEYIADYLDFSFDEPDDDVFRIPSACEDQVDAPASGQLRGFTMQMLQLLPSVDTGAHGDDAEYLAFCEEFGRHHADQKEYERRRETYSTHKALIEETNASNRTYKLAINKYADWTQEEFMAAMLPRRGMTSKPQPGQNRLAELPYAPKVSTDRVPAAVDWRGTGATGPVKDQATCGSCYAFGAVAAMQSALFMSTGKQVLLSEQQLVDCSWGFGENSACDGGMYDSAMDYIVTKAGGAVTEASYEYLGADGFCKATVSADAEPVAFKGYSFVPGYDDAALKEALYTRGPLATSIDASQPSFRFYSHGVYTEPDCLWKPDDLDHAVALVGYGTSDKDGDYWIVRNSWSTHWGDDGYIKISAADKACGVTSVPMYALVE
ncbi:hypothetical protein WJX74_001261 [Apatococcus lobatus]|uniref:Uncharacterized protein n=1 Tax=Apatococcus lobatus TaxID=904363 RepID=A0AAW1SEV3_9CHLO